MRHNNIVDSGKIGILFRDDERGKDFWANRNLIENNRVVNSGDADGIGISIEGQTHDTQVRNNVIVENREALNRTGIKIQSGVGNLRLENNRFEGYTQTVVDQRK